MTSTWIFITITCFQICKRKVKIYCFILFRQRTNNWPKLSIFLTWIRKSYQTPGTKPSLQLQPKLTEHAESASARTNLWGTLRLQSTACSCSLRPTPIPTHPLLTLQLTLLSLRVSPVSIFYLKCSLKTRGNFLATNCLALFHKYFSSND